MRTIIYAHGNQNGFENDLADLIHSKFVGKQWTRNKYIQDEENNSIQNQQTNKQWEKIYEKKPNQMVEVLFR